MNENIFDDVERDVASDEECEALLADIKSVRPRRPVADFEYEEI